MPLVVLYSVAAVLLVSGAYLLVTASSTLAAAICGLVNIVLGGTLISAHLLMSERAEPDLSRKPTSTQDRAGGR